MRTLSIATVLLPLFVDFADAACTATHSYSGVNMNGIINGNTAECLTKHQCKDVKIDGCDEVLCNATEACYMTKIRNSKKVTCDGKQACLSSSLDATGVANSELICKGEKSCDSRLTGWERVSADGHRAIFEKQCKNCGTVFCHSKESCYLLLGQPDDCVYCATNDACVELFSYNPLGTMTTKAAGLHGGARCQSVIQPSQAPSMSAAPSIAPSATPTAAPPAVVQCDASEVDEVWCIGTAKEIYHFDATTSTWTTVVGGLDQIAVDANSQKVVGLNIASGEVWYRGTGLAGNWGLIPSPTDLKKVAISGDGLHLWAVDSAGDLHYRPLVGDGTDAWKDGPTGENVKHITVASDGSYIWWSTTTQSFYYAHVAIAADGTPTVTKQLVAGGGHDLSVAQGGELWVEGGSNTLYYRPTLHHGWQNTVSTAVLAVKSVSGLSASRAYVVNTNNQLVFMSSPTTPVIV